MELNPDQKIVQLRKANHSVSVVIPHEFVNALHLFIQQPCYMRLDKDTGQLILSFQKTAVIQSKRSAEDDVLYDPFAPKNTE